MIQLHAKITPPVQIHAQVDEVISMEGSILEDQAQLHAEVKPGMGVTAKLLPVVLLVACLSPTISIEAQMLPPEWTDGIPANLITADGYFIETADGYFIETADGYLLCVQDQSI